MSTLSLIFVGFGNVGQALAELLERKQNTTGRDSRISILVSSGLPPAVMGWH